MRRLVLVAAICTLAPAGVALAAIDGTFTGKTSQGVKVGKVVIHVVSGVVPKRPQSTVAYRAHCRRGTLTGATVMHGTLHSGSFTVNNSRYKGAVGRGLVAHYTTSVHFAIHGRVATGTYITVATIVHNGKTYDHCSTGKLTFRATK